MSTSERLKAELAEERAVKAQALAARKATARRAYESGEMTREEIARLVRADDKTLNRWITEGKWRKQP